MERFDCRASSALILAATGHRPNKLGGYGEHVDAALRTMARHELMAREPRGVVSGMALGWDMAWAEAALTLSIPVCAAIPTAGQESVWPASSQERYRSILAQCAKIVIVSEGGYAAWKMQKRNEWIADKATRIVALWNGSPGGTANCIAYASKIGRPVDNLWNLWTAVYA